MPPTPTVGDGVDTIARLMAERGWSQSQLAQAADVSQGYLSRVLSRVFAPSDAWVDTCIRALTATDDGTAA